LAAYWEQSAAHFREKLPLYDASFLASPAVMPWVSYRGWRLEEECAEGARVRLRMRFDSEEEAVQFALSFGAGIEVLDPAELRDRVLDRAREVVKQYGG
jgi:predicted DNA-binding transcriptional regulator YafY